jgi:hypothetical protein
VPAHACTASSGGSDDVGSTPGDSVATPGDSVGMSVGDDDGDGAIVGLGAALKEGCSEATATGDGVLRSVGSPAMHPPTTASATTPAPRRWSVRDRARAATARPGWVGRGRVTPGRVARDVWEPP